MTDPQPDRDTAFTAWYRNPRRKLLHSSMAEAEEVFAAGWDAATQAALANAHLVPDSLLAEAVHDERQRIRQLALERFGLTRKYQEFADLLGGDHD